MRSVLRLAVVACAGVISVSLIGAAAQTVDPADLIKQARQLNDEGKQDAALALYRQVLERSPDLYDAHLGAGAALDLKGDYQEARRHFEKAIQVAPEAGKNRALTSMGISYAFEANAKNASTFYRQVFDRQMAAGELADAAGTANALARIYLECRDLDNAFKWYQTGYETSRRQPKLSGDQVDLWDLRWAHAQARIAARKGNARDARKQMGIVKTITDKGTTPDQ